VRRVRCACGKGSLHSVGSVAGCAIEVAVPCMDTLGMDTLA
jgi:hypothetical protein